MDLKNNRLLKSLLYMIFLFRKFNFIFGDEINDPSSFQIWGPGLQPQKIVLPARYFFIHAVNNGSSRISQNLQKSLEVTIKGSDKQNKPCRIKVNLLDRKDNTYIARYRLYDQCAQLIINVKYKNKHVGDSPYIFNENVYSEECNCPRYNVTELLNLWKCQSVHSQLIDNLRHFPQINWDVMRPKIIKQFDKPHSVSLCHYIIKDNKVYRKCYGKYVGFNMFSDSILLSLTRKAKLQDLEFFVNLGDWPLAAKTMPEKFPILSWCGSTETYDIIMPTYELTESTLENMGRVMVDILSVQGNVGDVWEKREPRLFWRGRDSNRHRLDLISLSRKHPDLFNVSLVNFFFFRDEEEIYGPKSEYISFYRFFDYKYQLSIDGTVAAYRMPFLLAGGSLVFKTESKYYEHFYNQLKPNIHYIPVKADLSDLVEKIKWAKENDDEAKDIAQKGQSFANENLLPKDIFCYHFHLINELSKIVTSTVSILDGMEMVGQKNDALCDCLEVSNINKDEL